MANDKTSQSSAGKQKLFYGYIIVLISFMVFAMHAGSRGTFGIFLKPMLTDIGLTRGLISGAFSLSLLMNALLCIPTGRLADRFGPRIIITFCGFFMGLGYLLMSQVNTAWQMYLFYGIFIGIGGTVYVPVVSTVARWFSRRRSMMTGIVGSGGSIGTLISPLLADWLISTYDWRLSFAILGSVILVVVVVSAQFLKSEPTKSGQIAYGDNTGSKLKSQPQNKELSLKQAVLTRQFWLFAMIFFIMGFCSWAIMVHIAPYVTDQGISATNAASIVAVIGGAAIVGRLGLGSFSDRFGESRAILIGFIMMSAAMIWLMSAKGLWMLYLFAVVFGFSWGTGAVGSPWIAETFGLRSLGSILGACNVGYNVGVGIGPLAAGYIYDMTNSYELAFLIVTIVAVSGILVTILLQSTQTKQAPMLVK
jgi:MFS family permease